MNKLASLFLEQAQFAKAEPLLRDCLKISEQKQPESWATFATKSMLGGTLLGQKKYAEAEPLLLAGYQGMKTREATIPAVEKIGLTEAVERLVQLYVAWDKPAEVAKWRAKLADLPDGLQGTSGTDKK